VTYGRDLAYSVRLLQPAEEDALEYASYIQLKEKSNEAAERWLNGLYNQLQGLSELPRRFPVIYEAADLGKEYRSLIYHSHRIIYEVNDSTGTVFVHRVYHGAKQRLTPSDIPPEE